MRFTAPKNARARSDLTPAVRRKGLEPLQELPHWNLNPARLPIPPPSLLVGFSETAAPSSEGAGNLDHPGPVLQLFSRQGLLGAGAAGVAQAGPERRRLAQAIQGAG